MKRRSVTRKRPRFLILTTHSPTTNRQLPCWVFTGTRRPSMQQNRLSDYRTENTASCTSTWAAHTSQPRIGSLRYRVSRRPLNSIPRKNPHPTTQRFAPYVWATSLNAANWYEEVLRRNPNRTDKQDLLNRISTLRR